MIPYVREIDPAYGEAVSVSPLIRRVTANNPGPFTYLGTGTYIVGGPQPGAELAVIDPGPDLSAHLEALMRATAGQKITTILTTHTHADHSPLAHPLKALTGAVIYGRRDPFVASAEEANEADFTPDVEIADGARVDGRGWTLEALTTPGHTSNHVCYALLEENALFSGDHVMGWSTTVVSPPDGDMTDYYASLDKVKAREFSTLIPTHGPPITDVAPFLEAYRDHRLDRERQIVEQLRAGRSLISEMVPVMYAAVDARLHPAASRSVLAHLVHMVRQGAVATDEKPGPLSRYRLA